MIKNPKMADAWAQTIRAQAHLATKLRLAPLSRYDALRASRRRLGLDEITIDPEKLTGEHTWPH